MPNKRNNRKKKTGNGNGNRNKRGRTTTRMGKNLTSNGLSSKGALRRPMINKPFIEAGTDFLGPLTVLPSPASAAERILLSNSISPTAFPGTRLTQLSNLWERYRFRKFRLRWVPAVPKTIACQLIVYQDTDPLDDPTIITDADALIRQATAQAGSQQFNFINSMAIELSQRSDDQLYYTGTDKNNERFSRQGNFYVIQVTDPLNFNGESLSSSIMAGSLYVDWVCEFQVAQINPSAVVQASFSVSAPVASDSNVVKFSDTLTQTSTLSVGSPCYIIVSIIRDYITTATVIVDGLLLFEDDGTEAVSHNLFFNTGEYVVAATSSSGVIEFSVNSYSAFDNNLTGSPSNVVFSVPA